MNKVSIAVFKFTSCSGCQLQVVNVGEKLFELLDNVEFKFFPLVKSDSIIGEFDIALVEGSITTPEEVKAIRRVRELSKILVAIGACSTAGGIQALRNWVKVDEFKRYVYPNPEWIRALDKANPISDYVKVDYELRGCPISESQLLYFLSQLLRGKRPTLPIDSVCMECKRKGNVCVLVTKGIPCLGPVTMAGCGAICPTYGRGCYGCFGPMRDSKPHALAMRFKELGLNVKDIELLFKQFTGWS
ncbi:MAG TPA: oxidoreductase, partial [Acidilobales archaeon]|nr:oxidoreductase [Acidilobales archaeon]